MKDKPQVIIVPENKHIVKLPSNWIQPQISNFMEYYDQFLKSEDKKVIFTSGDINISLIKSEDLNEIELLKQRIDRLEDSVKGLQEMVVRLMGKGE